MWEYDGSVDRWVNAGRERETETVDEWLLKASVFLKEPFFLFLSKMLNVSLST